ncbi:MAG: LysE family translocator [Sarcina sp.]
MFLLKASLFGAVTAVTLAFGLGPAGMEAVKRSLNNGFWSGFQISLGSIAADYTCIFMIHFGFSRIFKVSRTYEGIFFIISGIVLGAFNKFSNKVKLGNDNSLGFLNGYLITIVNPMNISVWLALSSTVMSYWFNISPLFYYIALTSMFLCTISWLIILNLLASKGVKKISHDNKTISNVMSKGIYYLLNIMAISFIVIGIYRMIIK